MRAHQLSFLPKVSVAHGGELSIGKRKTARPLDPKRPLHIVMRSSRARGEWSLLRGRNRMHIQRIVDEAAAKHGVRIHRFVNVGNHLHLLVGARKRAAFQNFLREISGRIAALVTGSRKTHPIGAKGERFWDHLVYTRIVSWGRELKAVKTYFIKNIFEAEGLLTRKGIESGLCVVRLE